ncbi:cobalamin-dependent protein [Candidatus Binatia bacterium]|nr:cobalamin-dependent protein [Candidatus Binatia bacterium]
MDRQSLRVLLISANREQLPDPVFPLGAAYMAAAASQHGHAVHTLDLCFLDNPLAAVAAAVRDAVPDVVGISLRNLDSAAYPENTSYIDDYAALVDGIRQSTAAPIVLGGAGFTVMPETILAHLAAEVGVIGEGELSFPWVLERIARGAELTSTAAVTCRRVGNGVCVAPAVRLGHLDTGVVPWRSQFDVHGYYERGGALNIQTKRGCVFECIFCSYPLIEGSRIRLRSARAVVDELQGVLEEHGARNWFFVDNVFNAPLRHAKEICEEIVARGLSIEWSGYLTPRFVDAELCDLMARSGCKAIEFGTDSGAPQMIATLKKEFDVDDLRRASELCRRYGLKFCHSLIFGGPGETWETVTQTLGLMDEVQPTAVIAMTGIRILPGTGMVERALADGQLDPDDTLLYPRFYVAPALGDDLVARIDAHARARRNWIVPGKGIRTNIEVLRRLRERRVKGQLWRLLR